MNNTDQKKSSRFIGEAALLVMTIIWGATFVIVKEAINDISSMLFVATRFGIAGLILLAVLYFKKQKTMLDEVRAGLFLGLLLFLGFFTQTIGLKYTSATKSGFLTGTLVVMVPLFQTIIEKKFPSKGAQLGTVLVFFGIIFLSSSANSLQYFFSEIGTNFGIGEQLTLACAVFFALHVVYIDIYTAKFNFWILLTTQIITVSILSLLTSFLLAGLSIEPIRINFSSYLIFGIIYTSIFATLITMGLQTRFQKVVSPTKAGIIYSFEPIFAALFAFFLLSEKITNFSLLGCGLIFLGLLSAEIMDYFFERKNGS
jgi:drug/metabolite transporter (DMT)-like permease